MHLLEKIKSELSNLTSCFKNLEKEEQNNPKQVEGRK